MSLYKQFETNSDFEQNGIEIDYGLNEAGKPIKFKIARAGGSNKAYSKALEKAIRPHKMALDNGNLANEVAEAALLEVFCTSVVVGWTGVTDRDGKEMPFTKANAIKLFTDLPDLYANLRDHSNKAALYRVAEVEDDLKN